MSSEYDDYSLGVPEAWDPSEREHLNENFLPVRQFSDISDKGNILLSGRRGSGKSAIALMLEREEKWAYPKAIQGEEGEYGEYMSIVGRIAKANESGHEINIKESIRRLWSWVLPVVAMQTIVQKELENLKEGQEPDEDVRLMHEYLLSLHPKTTLYSSVGHLLHHIFRDAEVLIPQGSFETALLDLVNSTKHNTAIQHLQNKTRKGSVLLVFDTLESFHMFQPFMIEGLQGILEAINAFLAKRTMTRISVKFFIPAEIYEGVIASFPGKIRNRTVFLRWRAADLLAVLAKRFMAVLRRTSALPEAELERLETIVNQAYHGNDGKNLRTEFWYDTKFLPRTIRNRLGKVEDTFAFILRHTMRRPRDLITAQMQSIVDQAVARGEFPYISEQSVIDGAHSPSALLQILMETLVMFDGERTTELVDMARTTFEGTPIVISGHQLKLFAKRMYDAYPPDDIDPESFLKHLLRCGLIGKVEEQTVDVAKSSVYLKAEFEHLMSDHLALGDRFTYCVHPVMADAFKMHSNHDCVVYPLPANDLWLEKELGIA